MFYNSQRITKEGIKELSKKNQISEEQNINNNRQKLIEMQNKEKLKDLLVVKYMRKFGIKNPHILLDDEIDPYIKGEKLRKIDLQRINTKISDFLKKQKTQKSIVKSQSSIYTENEHKLPEIGTPTLLKNSKKIIINPIHSSMSTGNLKTTISPSSQIKPENTEKENTKNNNNNNNIDNGATLNNTNNNSINESNTIGSKRLFRKKKLYIKPEEELAQLEKELGLDENAEKPKRGYERLSKFFSEGNEWVAIDKYNQKLYDEEVEEEKARTILNKRRLKEALDKQIKDKLKKEYEESIEEQKYRQSFNEYVKLCEKEEKEKQEALHKRFIIEKKNREEQLKSRRMMQRLEMLKQKKYEKHLMENVKKELENEKKILLERKMRENEVIRSDMQEAENNKKKKLERMKMEKEEDKNFCQELEKTEIKKELERKKILNRVRSMGDYEENESVKKILEKIRKDDADEEEKLNKYLIKKGKVEDEEIENEKQKRIKMKCDLKKYLELQMAEKKREIEFEKLLWKEQGKIWNIDSEMYKKEKKMINEKIKIMNLKNAEILREQIKNKKDNLKKNAMSFIEYSMNKKAIDKVIDSMEKEKDKDKDKENK